MQAVVVLGLLPAIFLQCTHSASAAGPYNRNFASAEESSRLEGMDFTHWAGGRAQRKRIVVDSIYEPPNIAEAPAPSLSGAGSKVGPSPGPQPQQSDAEKPPFWWGGASAAYQIEGGVDEGGRRPSLWDEFDKQPGRIYMGQSGRVASDFYHKYPEYIARMKELGIKHFRMSISWPRILPDGTGEVNPEGVMFYNDVFDALEEAGIEPYITLYHWDIPYVLYERYGGLTSSQFVDDFVNYATVVFKIFGRRATYWTTFNEPLSICILGYGSPILAPARNNSVEALLCNYWLLMSHAGAVHKFRELVPHGKISMNFACSWFVAADENNEKDRAAVKQARELAMGVYADPIYLGDWPQAYKDLVGVWLPPMSPQLRSWLNGTLDWFGMNFYCAIFARYQKGQPGNFNASFTREIGDGKMEAIGEPTQSPWLYTTPWAIRPMLNWINLRYHPAEIVITENGYSADEDQIPFPDNLNDTKRIDWYRSYLAYTIRAVKVDKIPVTGFFCWAMMDNYSWFEGYIARMGLIYVDFKTLKIAIKESGRWMAKYFGTA